MLDEALENVVAGKSSLLTCERDGSLAWAWRRAQRPSEAARSWQITETRSLDECAQALAATPNAVALVEFTTEHHDATFDFLMEAETRFPSTLVLVAAERRLAAWAPLLREAGAAWVATEREGFAQLIAMAERHASLHPQPAVGLREAVWAALPWESKHP